jgi:hypothetical protein
VATYTPEQIARLFYDAGVTDPGQLTAWVAITLRESGGRTDARNDYGSDPASPTGREDSRGLLQLNWQAHSSWLRSLGITSPEQLNDPRTNVRAALALYARDGWRPWGPYKGLPAVYGTEQHQAAARAAVQAVTGRAGTIPADARSTNPTRPSGGPQLLPTPGAYGGGASGPLIDLPGPIDIPNPLQPLAGAGEALALTAKALAWITNPSNWRRIGMVWLGGVLVAGAVVWTYRGVIARGATAAATGGASELAGAGDDVAALADPPNPKD